MKDFLNSVYEDHKEFFKKVFISFTDFLFTILLLGLNYLKDLLAIKFKYN